MVFIPNLIAVFDSENHRYKVCVASAFTHAVDAGIDVGVKSGIDCSHSPA